jgi:uncharacterized protein (DUF736 family)
MIIEKKGKLFATKEKKKMKKLLTIGTAAVLAMTLVACSSSTAATTTAAAASSAAATASASASAQPTKGTYTIYNATKDSVTSLYLYPTDGSDKGTNLAGDNGLKTGHAIVANYDAGKSGVKLTLEFTTKGGYTGTFTTLSLETAPITLLAEDAKTGATAIKFAAIPATYTIKNSTGEAVKELYLYPTGSSSKGENRVGDAASVDGQVVITVDDASALIKTDGTMGTYTLEFKTESGYTGSFTTLSYEVASIELIAESAKTGATAIKFGY